MLAFLQLALSEFIGAEVPSVVFEMHPEL